MVVRGGRVARRRGSDISWMLSGESDLCLGVFRLRGRSTGSAISTAPPGAVLVLVMPKARPVSVVSSHSSVSMNCLCGKSSGNSLS